MTWEITIENVAGILEGSATVEPGLNAVRASNWQGKSSFVAALETALGVAAPLTEGADRGRVTLRTDDRELSVDLRREDGTVRTDGEPYLGDEYDRVRADLFACLDGDNEIRRVVREGANLEDVLLRPLDFQDIDERIAEHKRERDRVDSELAGAREARRRLPAMRETVDELESELAELRETRDRLTDAEGGGAGSTTATQQDLASAQSERDRARSRVDRLERTIERTESRLEEKRAELADLEVVEDDVDAELAAARERLEELKRDAEVLQTVYSANELVLSENRLDLLAEVQRDLTGDTVVCWTCGSETPRSAVEDRLDDLGERIANLRAKTESHRDRVEELEARREDVARARRRRRDLEAEVADLEDTLADHRSSLDDARERLADAEDRVEDLAAAVDETVAEITDVESDIKYRRAELQDARDELDALETRAGRIDRLESERDRLDDEIERLRNRKDELEFEARAAFDEAMDDVLARFDTGFETARLTPEFDLVVARNGREASLDALSEGELELLGFVAALAGYESFDVAAVTPLLLVDSVGGLADDNLHTLIDYLRDRSRYLVFTVYPEHAAFEGSEIDPSDWTVATDRDPPVG